MISDHEKAVLYEVQRLPLVPNPFQVVAERLNTDVEDLLGVCESLLEMGVIRRFGPSVSHRRAGFTENPMTVLRVPEDELDRVGRKIAAEPGVTHCYSRSGWRYNLFFMIHGRSREKVLKRVEAIVEKTGITDYRSVFSTREFKKTSFEIPEPSPGMSPPPHDGGEDEK